MAQKRTKEGGTHDEEINVEGGKKKKKSIPISKHWLQFSSAFYSNCVGEQLPRAGPKQGFAVAG